MKGWFNWLHYLDQSKIWQNLLLCHQKNLCKFLEISIPLVPARHPLKFEFFHENGFLSLVNTFNELLSLLKSSRIKLIVLGEFHYFFRRLLRLIFARAAFLIAFNGVSAEYSVVRSPLFLIIWFYWCILSKYFLYSFPESDIIFFI